MLNKLLRLRLHKSFFYSVRSCNNHKGQGKKCEAILLDGLKTSKEILNELKEDIDSWVANGHCQPSLVVILVGNNPSSESYVKKKIQAAKEVGIISETRRYKDTINETFLIEKIEELNKDPEVDGILVQLPLPSHLNEENIVNTVIANKDVDGFHSENLGKVCKNIDTFISCTAAGVIELLKRYDIPCHGKNAVICGRSKYIGLPILNILSSDKKYELQGLEATVTLCHRNTPPEQLENFCQSADIIISATGVVGLIKPHMVKPGACVIDVGLTKIKTTDGKTKLVGDVDFEGVKKVAKYITPVPGGVGPMTVAMLMKNTLKAAKLNTSTKE